MQCFKASSVLSVDRLTNLLTRCEVVGPTLCFKNIMQIFDKILLSFFFIRFVPLVSVNFAPNSFCFSIFCLKELTGPSTRVEFLPYTSLLQKNAIFQKFLNTPLMPSPPPPVKFRSAILGCTPLPDWPTANGEARNFNRGA